MQGLAMRKIYPTFEDGERRLVRFPGRLDASEIRIFRTPPQIDEELVRSSPGYRDLDATLVEERITSLKGREVRIVRARPGKLGLLFGPSGVFGDSPTSSQGWVAKASRNRVSNPGWWERSLETVNRLTPNFTGGSATPSVLSLWRSATLLTGVHINSKFHGLSGGQCNPSVSGGGNKVAAPAGYSLETETRPADGKFAKVDSDGLFWYNGHYGSVRVRANDPAFDEDRDYIKQMGVLYGLPTDSLGTDCVAPMPLCSAVLGVAVGLPTNDGIICLEVDVEELAAGKVFTISRAFLDMSAGFLQKNLFPASTLPEAKQADALAAWDGIESGVRFRLGHVVDGFNYGSLTIEGTRLARDLRKTGQRLSSITIENPDPQKPDYTLDQLGAMAEKNIRDKRNTNVLIPLDASFAELVSTSQVTFERDTNFITATQSGSKIDSTDAVLSIRSGAPVKFVGVTRDEVAVELFLLPSWDDVLHNEFGEIVKGSYEIDEVQLSRNLMMDGVSDDELGRLIPFLIGYGRDDFAGPTLASLVSVSAQVRVDKEV